MQFQKIVIQAKTPTKEHFQQDKSISGKRTVFSIQQLTQHLTEIVELNISQEPESEGDGGVTYRNEEERMKNLMEEKAKLAKKLRESRQKISIAKSKKLLISKRVIHNCIEDGAEQPEWFNATVVRLAEDSDLVADAINTEYFIKYDIEEDEWIMPLLKDLSKDDLIICDHS